jgi:hypothetical protein
MQILCVPSAIQIPCAIRELDTFFTAMPLYFSQKNVILSVTMAQILQNKDMYRTKTNFVGKALHTTAKATLKKLQQQ